MASQIQRNEFVIYCDSQSALRVVDHYESTHPLICKIIIWIMKLEKRDKSVSFCWCPAHVGIPGNEAADNAAGTAIESNTEPNNQETPYRDWYPIIREEVRQTWSEEWQNVEHNKLRLLKDSVEVWPSSNCSDRKVSMILTRLRIGHTRATHQYLMERLPQPYCEDCLVPLTVKHFLAECPSHIDTRYRIYPEPGP